MKGTKRSPTGEPDDAKVSRPVRRGAAETGLKGNRADRPPYFQAAGIGAFHGRPGSGIMADSPATRARRVYSEPPMCFAEPDFSGRRRRVGKPDAARAETELDE